jgi:hypothetical protein
VLVADLWIRQPIVRPAILPLGSIPVRNREAGSLAQPIQGAEWQVGRLAALSKDQQRALIVKWLSIHHRRADSQQPDSAVPDDQTVQDVEKAADEFIYKLAKSNDLSQLAEIPLTLLLLLYLHLQNYPLPANRFEAYEYVTNHFIREHPLARRTAATLTEEQSPLTPEEIRNALGYVAYVAQTEFPGGALTTADVRACLVGFLQDDMEHGLGLPPSEAREVLRSFTNLEEGSLGLLVSQGQSVLSFFSSFPTGIFGSRSSGKNILEQPGSYDPNAACRSSLEGSPRRDDLSLPPWRRCLRVDRSN